MQTWCNLKQADQCCCCCQHGLSCWNQCNSHTTHSPCIRQIQLHLLIPTCVCVCACALLALAQLLLMMQWLVLATLADVLSCIGATGSSDLACNLCKEHDQQLHIVHAGPYTHWCRQKLTVSRYAPSRQLRRAQWQSFTFFATFCE
jgi:hypothetical protein